jgi:hypothetical protein
MTQTENTAEVKKRYIPYNSLGEGGRPVKWTIEQVEIEADAFSEFMQRPDVLYYKEFCLERGYHPKRLTEFALLSEKFSRVYEQSKVWQETRISKKALNNEVNSGFSKFFMSNVCGWSEKQETKITGDQQNPLAFVMDLNGQSKELIAHVEEQQIEYKVDDVEASGD